MAREGTPLGPVDRASANEGTARPPHLLCGRGRAVRLQGPGLETGHGLADLHLGRADQDPKLRPAVDANRLGVVGFGALDPGTRVPNLRPKVGTARADFRGPKSAVDLQIWARQDPVRDRGPNPPRGGGFETRPGEAKPERPFRLSDHGRSCATRPEVRRSATHLGGAEDRNP